MIEIKNLVKEYQGKKLRYPDFTATSGDFVAIYGKSGTGKSTLCEMIMQQIEFSEGEIIVEPYKIDKNIFNHIHYISQNPEDNLIGPSVVDDLNLWCGKGDHNDLLREFNLSEQIESPVWKLSFGQKKALAYSALRISNKKIWLLDEPFIGMDDNIKQVIIGLFIDFMSKGGTIIVTSHTDNEFSGFANIEIFLAN
jgi:ABC-type multidrug transport system ATPase subunit